MAGASNTALFITHVICHIYYTLSSLIGKLDYNIFANTIHSSLTIPPVDCLHSMKKIIPYSTEKFKRAAPKGRSSSFDAQ